MVNEVSCLFVRPEVERVHRGLIYRPLRNFNAFRFGRELQGGTSSLSPALASQCVLCARPNDLERNRYSTRIISESFILIRDDVSIFNRETRKVSIRIPSHIYLLRKGQL